MLAGRCGQRRDNLARVAADEHDERPEAELARPLQQFEPVRRVVGHDRGREPSERSRVKGYAAA